MEAAMATRRQLMNSAWFDVKKWSDHKNVSRVADMLMADLNLNGSKYKNCLAVIVLNLYSAWRADPNGYVAYSRDETKYVNGQRNFTPRFGFTVMTNTVEALSNNGYIEHHIGSNRMWDPVEEEFYGFMSRMRATEKLIRVIVKHRIKVRMINRLNDNDYILQRAEIIKVKKELKGKKTKTGKIRTTTIKIKNDIKIDESNVPEHVNRSRKILYAYNKLLSETYIDVDTEHLMRKDRAALKKKQYNLDLTRKQVYRIFSNGKWTQGGRFYRAWWIECPKALRKYIIINGNSTVELDYSGVHIQLLYAIQGINYAARNEDPYRLEGFPHRKLNKLVLLTAINAQNDKDAVKATWSQIRKDKLLMEYGLSSHKPLHDILEALKRKHHEIQDCIASGYGIKLQYIDSQIAERIVEYFTTRKIPILTVHDSFIVESITWRTLEDVMKREYAAEVRRFLKLTFESTQETIWYDGRINVPVQGDTIINVDITRLKSRWIRAIRTIPLHTYKQGRRYRKYRLTNDPYVVARISN